MPERLTRERIIDAAEAIVESEGLAGLSMRALCEKLDVSVTSIYWHVGNKDALLDALVERTTAIDRRAQAARSHITATHPIDRPVGATRHSRRTVS